MIVLRIARVVFALTLWITLAACHRQQLSADNSFKFLNAGDVKKIVNRNQDIDVVLMASDTALRLSISQKNKPVQTILIDKGKLSSSTFHSDENGVLWEIIDLDGDGIPEYRISRSGPRV